MVDNLFYGFKIPCYSLTFHDNLLFVREKILRIQVERLMTSVIAFVVTVDWLRCEANWPTLLDGG